MAVLAALPRRPRPGRGRRFGLGPYPAFFARAFP